MKPHRRTGTRSIALGVLGVLALGLTVLFAPREAAAKIQLVLKNNSYEDISVAINYLAPNGRWITRGWWQVESGKTLEPNVTSENNHFYFYAEGSSGGRWDGADDPEGINRWVVKEKFDWYDDAKGAPPGTKRREASFFHAEAEDGYLQQSFSD